MKCTRYLVMYVGILLLFTSNKTFAQTLYAPKVESPNAASLGKFGEVPLSLFTGTPGISIPLHTVSYGNISVPISLRYHPSSVKPAQQPGWVGSGWDLESIGTISRQVRGAADETYVDDLTSGNFRSYYPYPSSSSQANANNFGSYLANIYPWGMANQMKYDFFPNDCLGIDVQADEFSFNVLGHSGKFYYEGSTLGWKVVSDENIKVEMTGFYTPLEIGSAIQGYSVLTGMTSLIPMPYQPRQFGSFTLTFPDGTKCSFGGKTGLNVPDAVEFNCPIGLITTGYSANPIMTANTWLLRTVTDPNGNQVNFYYTRRYPTCNKFYTASNYAMTIVSTGCFSSDNGGQLYDKNKLSGIFQWPMYLSSISTPNESVNFTMSEHTYNRYTDNQLKYADQSVTQTTTCDNSLLGFDGYGDKLAKLQWEKLDKIVVTDNMHNSTGINNYNPNTIKQFDFTYLNTPSSPNQRLLLGALVLKDNSNTTVGQYQFTYNSDFSTQNSPKPIYPDGNFTDHWGFYNGTDLPANGNFSVFRYPSPSVVTTELLKKLTYPTGGYTDFTWEANDYSQIVSVDRQSLTTSTGYGGGARIAEIKNVLTDGSIASDKKYYYKTGYTAGANLSLLPSSGVLNGNPVYTFSFSSRPGVNGTAMLSGTATSMTTLGNYTNAGEGSPVGYKEVYEVDLDGSYTKNVFTSYDADLNGVTHYDKPPVGILGFVSGQDNYMPMSSLEGERGKPIGKFYYTPTNTLLQKIITSYRSDFQRFSTDPVNLIENTSYYTSEASINYFFASHSSGGLPTSVLACSDGVVFAASHYAYTYSYYPVSQTTTTYDEQGANPVVQTTSFTYNPNNLLRSKTEINSKNESIVTNYLYPTDLSDAASMGMVAAHILSPVIEQSVTNNLVPTSLIHTNYYEPYTGIFVPQTIQVKVGGNTIETREQVNKYDAKGHVQEIQKPNNVKEVYIWGCNSQYLMAKITGSDYATASALINQSMLDQAGVGYNNYSDADIRTELNKLRTGLPNAFVTTYTYKCGVGLATETDPRGITSFYVYDSYGRLSLIVDKDQNVLKKFCYDYAGQTVNCSTTLFGNDIQQATFTKNNGCAAGTTAPTYTYTVPANTFNSAISKELANQAAVNSLNANGQLAANALSCLATITSHNTTSAPWVVTITNTAGTYTNSFNFYPSANNLLTDVPVGTYNISIAQMYAGSVTVPVQLVLNGVTSSGLAFNITNYSITTSISLTLQPVPVVACSFTMSSGFTTPTNSISSGGSTANFYLVFTTSNSMNPGSSYTVATINGSCRPLNTQSIPFTSGGRSWTITIYPSGQMNFQLGYTSPAVSAGQTISTPSLSYNLY
jgi:YD repeat-containing protein